MSIVQYSALLPRYEKIPGLRRGSYKNIERMKNLEQPLHYNILIADPAYQTSA